MLLNPLKRFSIVIALAVIVLGAVFIVNQGTSLTNPCNIRLGNVEGMVVAYSTHAAASGLTIYQACNDGTILGTTRTNATGYFAFHSNASQPNQDYLITVNGAPEQLGRSVQNATWGQWAGAITTNSTGYAKITILIEPATSVRVPLAAFFTNSAYVRINYTATSSDVFRLNFAVSTPDIRTGFSSIVDWSWSGLRESGEASWYHFIIYSAATLWCDSGPLCEKVFGGLGIRVSGIVQRYSGQNIQSSSQGGIDYVDPLTLNEDYVDFRVSAGASIGDNLTMIGSMTWSRANGAPFSISFVAYRTLIDLSTSVRVIGGGPNLLWTAHNTSSSALCFREYSNQDLAMKKVGPEFHLWEILCST